MADLPEECIHSIVLTPEECTLCRQAPLVKTHPNSPGVTFPARLPGQCPSCDLPIQVGQHITRWDDGRYRHSWCWE